MYTKEFDIRWSDLDSNRHLANSAYINYMSHVRMAFLIEAGLGHDALAKANIGPVVFYEHVYYFREIFGGKPVKVTLKLKGLAEDGMFFEFAHNFYDTKGRHCAHCEMLGGWIDLKSRKLIGLPKEYWEKLNSLTHTEDFKVLTREDTRKFGKKPQDIDPSSL